MRVTCIIDSRGNFISTTFVRGMCWNNREKEKEGKDKFFARYISSNVEIIEDSRRNFTREIPFFATSFIITRVNFHGIRLINRGLVTRPSRDQAALSSPNWKLHPSLDTFSRGQDNRVASDTFVFLSRSILHLVTMFPITHLGES